MLFIVMMMLNRSSSKSIHPFMKSNSSNSSKAMPSSVIFDLIGPSAPVLSRIMRLSSSSSLRLLTSSSSSMGHATMPSFPLVMEV